MDTKVCKRCGEEKPLKSFARANKGSERRRSDCSSCRSKRQWNKDPERSRAISSAKRKEWRKKNPSAAIWQDSRKDDKRRGFENDLTKEGIRDLISRPCSYCGEAEIRMTLDRIDNSIGHLQSNVVPACIRCNYTRGNMPYKAWLQLASGMQEAREKGLFGGWTGRCR